MHFQMKMKMAMKFPRRCCESSWSWGLTAACRSLDRKGSLICNIKGGTRLYSSSSHDIESFDIPCGSSGCVLVDLHGSHLLNSPGRPLIIYLPPTGVHLRHTHPPIPSFLSSHPLAAINYRWSHLSSPKKSLSDPTNASPFTSISTSHPFPTPLHDTLYAYTWLTNHYLPSRSSSATSDPQDDYYTPPPSPRSRLRSPYSTEPPRSKIPPRPLIIYGSHLGGTLATSLALTESRSSKTVTFPIAGLIALNGIYDWTNIATSSPPPTFHSSTSPSPSSPTQSAMNPVTDLVSEPWTLQTLHSLKPHLFTRPAYAFDAFASPVLFFRTPAVAIPRSPFFPGYEPSSVDIEPLSLSDAEYAALRSAEFDTLPATACAEEKDKKAPKEGKLEEQELVRSSHMKFPPKDSGLRIPRSLFLCTSLVDVGRSEGEVSKTPHAALEGDVGKDERVAQSEEMARLMRRSVVLHEFKDRVMWDEETDPHAASEDRVQVEMLGARAGTEEKIVGAWLDGCGV
ncbi:hypothetical protein D0Z07_1932 [Hyphodiscus hymeniophilus]|uniref:Alpha/beta hydrolase fold-3 domain-containing protein n=1 Tax=Hyphodiscus hymeniophilus TaxID=353542 RepID=A0A9P6VNZ7_9HELO|nr:hypothetical protein D0Z07_1932 [Hyphodiscus hymeniophilus]